MLEPRRLKINLREGKYNKETRKNIIKTRINILSRDKYTDIYAYLDIQGAPNKILFGELMR